MEATQKNICQLEYETTNRRINTEFSRRSLETHALYYQRQKTLDDKRRQEKEAIANLRNSLKKQLEEAQMQCNEMHRSGLEFFSPQMEENTRVQKRIEAQLQECRFNESDSALEYKHRSGELRLQFQEQCHNNSAWRDEQIAQNKEDLQRKMLEIMAQPPFAETEQTTD